MTSRLDIEYFFAPPAKVHIRCFLATGEEPARATLSQEELDRASRFHFERDRVRYIRSHVKVRQILGEYLLLAPGRIEFGTGSKGKPFVKHPSRSIDFNLSHSGDLALIAVTNGAEVGIDIERITENRDFPKIARRFFSKGESDWIDSLEGTERKKGFYRLWAAKEACIKAAGGGLSIPLDQFEIRFNQNEAAIVTSDAELSGPWTIRELQVADGYAAAVAVRAASCEVTLL